jgi:hypothetical protein
MSARIKQMMDIDFEKGYSDKGTPIPPNQLAVDLKNKTLVETPTQLPTLKPRIKPTEVLPPTPKVTVEPTIKPLMGEPVKPKAEPTVKAKDKPLTEKQLIEKALAKQKEIETGVIEPTVKQEPIPTLKKKPDNILEIEKPYNEEIKRLKEQMNKGVGNKEMIQGRIKQLGFEKAAEVRKAIQGDSLEYVEGGFTSKELANAKKREATNYVGKKVTTPYGEGTIAKNSFGKVGVEFADGEIKYLEPSEVVAVKKVATPKVEPTPTVKPIIESKGNINGFVSGIETPKVGTSTGKFKETVMKSEYVSQPIKDRIEAIQKEFDLPTTSNEARYNVADKIVSDNFEDAVNLVKTGDKFNSSVEQFIARRVVDQLNSSGREDEAVEVLLNQAKKLRASGQEVQSASIWNKATPEGMQKWTLNTLKDTKIDKEKQKEIAINVGKRMKELKEQTDPAELKKLVTKQVKGKVEKALLNKLIADEGSQDRIVNLATNQIVNDVIGMSKGTRQVAGRMVSTGQAISHLLNATTTLGNIYGNVASILSEVVGSKGLGSLVDIPVSWVTGKRSLVNKTLKPSVALKQGYAQARQSATEILAGAGNISPDKDNLVITPAFKNVPIMRELEKALGLTLSTTDEFFKGMITADSMYNQLYARIGKAAEGLSLEEIKKQVTPQEFQRALEEAKFITFQNDSLVSSILTGAKNVLNLIGVGDSGRSLHGMPIKEFGLGDLVIKYSRVPGNIIARTVDMTPVGYAKALRIAFEIGADPTKQREFSQTFGRAMTGSGLTLAGMWLSKNGVIVGEDDKGTARQEQLKRSENLSGYKLNVSALNRLIKGESPELKEGDKLSTFVWLGPVAAILTMGAATNQAMEKGEDVGKAYSKAQGKTFNQIMDLPSLYTASKLYSEMRKEPEEGESIGGNAYRLAEVVASESLPGFVPSPVRQLAQGIDPVIRETKGKTMADTTKNKIKANIPFLSKSLEPRITPTGVEATRSVGPVRTFLDRGATEPYKPTAYTSKLNTIKELTGSTSHYPITFAPNTIKDRKGEKIELTPQEKTMYMRIVGSFINEKYTKLLANKNNISKREAESLIKRLSEIRSDATDKAKKEILRNR